jgi:AmpD protein
MKIKNHWFIDIPHIHSPNFNNRPNENDVSLIVIHCISLPPQEFGGNYIDALFCNQLNPNEHRYFEAIHMLQVSAHLLIRRDGECVQYVPFDKRAWHAGVSHFQGRENCNDFSIGIELEGYETIAYTDAQYETLNVVINSLKKTYPKLSHITGHSNVAPERKTDPGRLFDWSKLTENMF